MSKRVLIPAALIITLGLMCTLIGSPIAQEAPVSDPSDVSQLDQLAPNSEPEIHPIRTDSPRETLRTFRRLRRELEVTLEEYWKDKSWSEAGRWNLVSDQLSALIDLSSVRPASREYVGNTTVQYLLDILGRVHELDLRDVPTADEFKEGNGQVSWRIPNTPIRITHMQSGPRQDEFLFSEQTVQAAPRFFRSIQNMPLRSSIGITSWSGTYQQLTGPMIPTVVHASLPESLTRTWLDTPIWKVLTVVLVALLSGLALAGVHRLLTRVELEGHLRPLLWRLVEPLLLITILVYLQYFFSSELIIIGQFSTIVTSVRTLLLYCALAWLLWIIIRIIFEFIILSPRISPQSIDANLLRLLSGVLGIVGIILLLSIGAHKLGLPVLSLLTGLGIGGLAVALAVRPTLENLIGGFVLYLDKPVQVGDFCSFVDKLGTVESIGVRSTQIRGLDRTQITIPNASFADMQIVNWARCDQMLIKETLGVRYETQPDQLRKILAELHKMLSAHPRIDSDSVRVRFDGYGDSSLNISVRVYADTRDWNDFFAIREDVLLRVHDIVSEAGSGFAFPSRTVYLSRDEGLNVGTGEEASDQDTDLDESLCENHPTKRAPES